MGGSNTIMGDGSGILQFVNYLDCWVLVDVLVDVVGDGFLLLGKTLVGTDGGLVDGMWVGVLVGKSLLGTAVGLLVGICHSFCPFSVLGVGLDEIHVGEI